MNIVYVVVCEFVSLEWYHHEVMEVFTDRAVAECYVGNFPHDDMTYKPENFKILPRKLWDK